jgi:hypothetical protein
MPDEIDWDFSSPDDAKAELRAAVGYLLKDAAGSDRGDIVREIIAIVNEVARRRLDIVPSGPHQNAERNIGV